MKAPYEQPSEGGGEEDKMASIRQKILDEEERIDKLHELGPGSKADINGIGIRELFESDPDVLMTISEGPDILNLNKEETKEFEHLCSLYRKGELNDDGKEKERDEFIRYIARVLDAKSSKRP